MPDWTLRAWVLLVLGIAAGEWLGIGLAQGTRALSGRATSWWARRTLRRELPTIERRSYAQRELDRQQLAADLEQAPGATPETVAAGLATFDQLTESALRTGLARLRQRAGIKESA